MKSTCILSFILFIALGCKREAMEELPLAPFSYEDDISFIPIDSVEYDLIFNFFEKKKKRNEDYQVKKVIKDHLGNKHVFRFFSDVDDAAIKKGEKPNRAPRYVIDAKVYDEHGSSIVNYLIKPNGFSLQVNKYTLKHHSKIMASGYFTLLEKAEGKRK
jgi:hypothetical protein